MSRKRICKIVGIVSEEVVKRYNLYDFVYYDLSRNSLLYFNKIDENVCVVVRLNLRKNKDNYVASIYPVNMHKILRLKEQSYIKKDYE